MTSHGHVLQDAARHVAEVELRGHIIDSLLLPKILDVVTSRGGAFRINLDCP